MGKEILHVAGQEVQFVAGCAQLCAGQRTGCEAVVHAMSKLFDSNELEAVLLVDTKNMFNFLN